MKKNEEVNNDSLMRINGHEKKCTYIQNNLVV